MNVNAWMWRHMLVLTSALDSKFRFMIKRVGVTFPFKFQSWVYSLSSLNVLVGWMPVFLKNQLCQGNRSGRVTGWYSFEDSVNHNFSSFLREKKVHSFVGGLSSSFIIIISGKQLNLPYKAAFIHFFLSIFWLPYLVRSSQCCCWVCTKPSVCAG